MGLYYYPDSAMSFFKHISRKLLDIMMGFEAGCRLRRHFGPTLATVC